MTHEQATLISRTLHAMSTATATKPGIIIDGCFVPADTYNRVVELARKHSAWQCIGVYMAPITEIEPGLLRYTEFRRRLQAGEGCSYVIGHTREELQWSPSADHLAVILHIRSTAELLPVAPVQDATRLEPLRWTPEMREREAAAWNGSVTGYHGD